MQQNTSSCYRSEANNETSLIPTYNWSYVEQHAYWIRCSYVYSKIRTRTWNPGLTFLKPENPGLEKCSGFVNPTMHAHGKCNHRFTWGSCVTMKNFVRVCLGVYKDMRWCYSTAAHTGTRQQSDASSEGAQGGCARPHRKIPYRQWHLTCTNPVALWQSPPPNFSLSSLTLFRIKFMAGNPPFWAI